MINRKPADPWSGVFFTRPIAAFLTALAIISIARGIWLQIRCRAPEVAVGDQD